ncbi:MAG: hypothetical protein Q7J35_03060 [Candidatus Methanoperedens sp.]|nr:hypothetical protein [Candidatus Methanoperedens sp.]
MVLCEMMPLGFTLAQRGWYACQESLVWVSKENSRKMEGSGVRINI